MLSGVVKEFICHMRIFFLTSSELRFAIKGFALMVILFFVIEFLICQLDDSRAACRLVERGLFPSLAVFAVMDLLVIPRLRRRIKLADGSMCRVGFPHALSAIRKLLSCNIDF